MPCLNTVRLAFAAGLALLPTLIHAAPPVPTGRRLKTIAQEKKLFLIGASASPWEIVQDPQAANGGATLAILPREYDIVTWDSALCPGNWNSPGRGQYDFTWTDKAVSWAAKNGFVTHGAHLVGWDLYEPDWFKKGTWSKADLDAILGEQITAIVSRYKKGSPTGRVAIWNVVNEAVEASAKGGNWPAGSGGWRVYSNKWMDMGYDQDGIPLYISRAFTLARRTDPSALLVYNEGQNEGMGIEYLNKQSDMVYEMCKKLRARGVPIDAVGFQAHVGNDDAELKNLDTMAANIDRFAALGMKVLITEFDTFTEDDSSKSMQREAEIYRKMMHICLSRRNVIVSFETWGTSDAGTWLKAYSHSGHNYPLPFDTAWAAKPAYYALQDELEKYRPSRRYAR